MDQTQFESMLHVMQSCLDNTQRSAAEATYEQTKTADPLWTMHALVEVAATTQLPEVRAMALILLRKMFGANVDFFDKADEPTREAIKTRLLEIFGHAASSTERKSASACVAALAVKLSANKGPGWPALWENLFHTIQTADAPTAHRAASCDVIAHTATTLATTYLEGHLEGLARGLQSCINDKELVVRKAAFEATASVAAIINEKKHLPHFRPLVTSMLSAVEKSLNASDWQGAMQLCSTLSSATEQTPALFAEHTTELLQAMMQVASVPQVPGETRHMAVEVMVSYCESEPKAVKKVPGFTKSLFELLFNYLVHPTIDEDWDTKYEDEEGDDAEGVEDFDVGATSMDRIASAIRPKQLQEIAQTLVMANITSESWQHRYAAVTTLTYVAEGLSKVFKKNLAGILQMIAPLLHDTNKVVRYGALSCLAQFAADFSPDFETFYHAEVLPMLLNALADLVPRCQSAAAAAINSFFDSAEDGDDDDRAVAKRLSGYIETMCEKLVALVQHGVPTVKSESLKALSSIISTGKEFLRPYVDHLVPVFQAVLGADDSSPQAIRDKCAALECTTLLAASVGAEAFRSYAHPVCEYLNSVLGQGLANDDPRLRYVLRGWTCMVECLQEEVLPYLSSVMPPLLSVANLDCDLEIIENDVGDDAEDHGEEEDEDTKLVKLCLPGIGEQTVKIKTGLIEDKELATTIILSIVQELKGKMQPYMNDITQMACKLLDFQATSDIRENGAQILGDLVACYTAAEPQSLSAFVHHILPLLLEALKGESDLPVLGEYLTTIGKSVNSIPGHVNEDLVGQIGMVLKGALVESAKRRVELAKRNHEAADDEEELEELQDEENEEEYLLEECSGCIQQVLQSCPPFVQHFGSEFMPIISTLLGNDMSPLDHKTGLSILCDFVEFGKAAAVPHLQIIAQAYLHYTAVEDETLFQAAVYGLNVTITLCATNFQQPHTESVQLAQSAVQNLTQYFNSKHASHEDYTDATCNAVSCALNIIDSFGDSNSFDPAALLRVVERYLPVGGDDIEAVRVHDRLLHWVQNNHPLAVPVRANIIDMLKRVKEPFISKEAAAAVALL